MAQELSDEFINMRIEQQIIAQLERHEWATAVSVADPLDILILFEDEDQEITNINAKATR
jgi:hypothetical protein